MVVSASSMQINEASRVAPAFNQFVCGLCQFIVTPFPLECPTCNALYCEQCVKMQRSWSCTVQNCRSRQRPTEMHRSVKEILELINFSCPGCGTRKRYQAFFNHVQTCEEIRPDAMHSSEQIQQIVVSNQNQNPVVQHNF